jgi:hypothetical protein
MKIASFAVFVVVVAALRPASAQTLTRGDIQRGIQAVRPAVDRCLRSAGISTVVKARVEIANGRVAAIRVEDAGSATGCIAGAVRRARFPRASRPMSFVYPFVAPVTAPGTASITAPAPPTVGPASSRLTREQIARGIQGIRPAAFGCRPRGGRRVVVTVRFDIAGGRAIGVRGASRPPDARTVACVEQAVMRATFPLAQRTTVRYPFVLD